ncbi:hypothetical protein KDK_50540 [Dictyobacter kobayashii]|uniref:Uncharacterized protein n=1 Tax=Dictyobacter kobayashii TaxID=2014872 RepID=A0A402AQC7_9CHLR|nr:hypothetical protein KDK_50540 [Dictyobacter kobayashii]
MGFALPMREVQEGGKPSCRGAGTPRTPAGKTLHPQELFQKLGMTHICVRALARPYL